MPYVRSLTAVGIAVVLCLCSCAAHRATHKGENDNLENPGKADTSKAAIYRQGIKGSLREKMVPAMKAKIDSTDKD